MVDFTPVISEVYKSLIWFIPLIFVIAFFKSPIFKGMLGEFAVNLTTKLSLDKKIYHNLKNITLPTDEGTTQIDHIVVSIYGIFVIETKNMKGWIFGSENQRTWTQKIYKHTNKFQNPLHQNYKHTKTLQNLLGLSDDKVFSVIVFVGESTFKTDMPANVTQGGGYIRYIKSKNTQVLTEREVTKIISDIEHGRLEQSFKTHKNHVKHVRGIVQTKQDQTFCPKCGSTMVIRELKNGPRAGAKFWGCSKFPQCRGTKNAA